MTLLVKNLPANAGDTRDTAQYLGWEGRHGGRHDDPLQYSCLENPLDRGDWWATVHKATESDMTEVTEHEHAT